MNTNPQDGGTASNPVDHTALSVFDFNENPVRVLMRDDEPWFVAADVCRVLEIEQVTCAIRELDEDEKITLVNTKGNPRAGIPHQMNLISESGMYTLVFKSRKPEAKTFRKWVTSEVLPSLRKTGSYEIPQAIEEEEEEEDLEASPKKLTECPVNRIPVTVWLDRFPQELFIILGRRVKAMALALGVTVHRQPSEWLGSVYSYPEELYYLVLKDLERDESFNRRLSGGKRRRRRSK